MVRLMGKCFYFYILCINIPLDWIHSKAVYCVYDVVAVVAVRRAEQQRFHSGHSFDFVVAFGDLLCHFLLRKLRHVWVRVRMIADLVTRRDQRFYGIRVFVDPRSDNKKCCFHVVFCENVNQRLSLLISP